MLQRKSKNATLIVKKKVKTRDGATRLVTVGYLTEKDEENGEDARLDLAGYVIEVID